MSGYQAPPPPMSGVGAMLAPAKLDLTPRKPAKPIPRIVLYGSQGTGKTTMAATAPNPVIVSARDEKGVQALIDSSQIPEIPVIDCKNWQSLLDTCEALATQSHDRQTIAFDSIGSFERLAVEHVCQTEYAGNWEKFEAFGRGWTPVLAQWMIFLNRLDRLNERGMTILLLGHSKVGKFTNPEGPDYNRFVLDANEKVNDATIRWADANLFIHFRSFFAGDGAMKLDGKAKAVGGTERRIATTRTDARDAKNRYSLPEFIELPKDPFAAWRTLDQHLQAATKGKAKQ